MDAPIIAHEVIMSGRFLTKRSKLQYVSQQAAAATIIATAYSVVMCLWFYGSDMRAYVEVGYVFWCCLALSVLAAMSLSIGLGIRSANLLCKLDQTRAELFELSRTDALSGLLNRRGFQELANSRILEANKLRLPVALLLCDLDLFKKINDKFGHEVGDMAIARIAKVLRDIEKQETVLVGRHGGEEFAVLVTDPDPQRSYRIAETIRKACSGQLISTGTTSFYVTMSIGLAVKEASDLPSLLRAADAALYAAKEAGRNRVARFDRLAA
jgi:diguanylate cyclase (GGDEF)-like protein